MKLSTKNFAVSCACCAFTLLLNQPLLAAADDSQDSPATATSQPVVASDSRPPGQPSANAVPTEGKLSRWFDMNAISFSLRYRSEGDRYGNKAFEFGQQRSLIDGKLKLDSEGKYAVNFHISSGRYFNWAYADEIGGSFGDRAANFNARFPTSLRIAQGQAIATDPYFLNEVAVHRYSRGWEMYVRELYLTASPIKQLTFEYGGLPIEHGVNTEMTTYDDDGYMTGGRVRLKDADHLFFDQLTATFGFLGDIYEPNLFDRGNRLIQSNYHQFLAEKKLTGRLDTTVDWTEHFGTHTWREAALVSIPESKVLDSVRLELYQRTNDINLSRATFAGGNGFGITGSKDILKKWRVEGGYGAVDANYGVYTGSRFLTVVGHSINGDAFTIGNRLFGRAAYKPNQYITFFGYYTHTIDSYVMTLNKETVYGGAEFNVKNALNSAFHLF